MEYDALPMTDELLNAMTVHRQSAKFDWVFTNQENGEPYKVSQKHIRQLCKRAGVKAFGYHAIKHLTARPALEVLSNRNSRSTFTTMNQTLKPKESEAV